MDIDNYRSRKRAIKEAQKKYGLDRSTAERFVDNLLELIERDILSGALPAPQVEN